MAKNDTYVGKRFTVNLTQEHQNIRRATGQTPIIY